jgi:hypothetical protein
MLYIHQYSCISPQHTFGSVDLDTLVPSTNNRLKALEPAYAGIPPGMLRRMGKCVKITLGAAMPLVSGQNPVDGIIIGSGNGGLEDSIRFLDQIVQYEEGMLTPANFVQSTANAMAAQISLLTHNHAYNTTHVHRGLAFENALLDAWMLAEEHPLAQWLVGGVDEISDYHLNIETLNGTFKADPCDNGELYASVSKGSLAGEGAAMFRVGGTAAPNGSASPNGAAADGTGASHARRVAAIAQVDLFHSTDPTYVQERLQAFIGEDMPDLVLIGENGDPAFSKYYDILNAQPAALARFKHMSGESPTASAFATWLATHVIQTGASLPAHMIKREGSKTMDFTNVVIYNTYQGRQQGMIRVKLAQ